MFDVDHREQVRAQLLRLAEADPDVAGAAITGSAAVGGGDRWSDIDLAFAINGELGPALARWTETLYREFAAQHHWDLPSGSTTYRVFLLPGWLEVECPVCGLYRVERQFWITAHFKKARQPVLYRRLAWWLEESRPRAEPPEIPFEGWESVAGSRDGA